MKLGLDTIRPAVVAIDCHRGHLDPNVATMPASPEIAARLTEANRRFFDSARQAREYSRWLQQNLPKITEIAESTTSVGKLLRIETYLAHRFAFCRFDYTTGDAAGQNMVSNATFAATSWIISQRPEIRHFYLESNFATDKKSSQVNVLLMTGAFRQENTLPFGKIVAYSDSKIGWMHSQQGPLPLTGAQLRQVQGEIFRNYIGLLLSDSNADRTVSLAGENTLLVSAKDGQSVELKIDPVTKLISSESYTQVQPAGPPSQVTVGLSDYKEVDGIKVPFKITLGQGGQKVADATVSEYKFNTGMKPEELAKQPSLAKQP